MGEIKNQTLSGVKWTFIERFSIQFVTFFIGLVVARLLTPADYGIVGILSIFMTVSNVLIDGGIGNALVRKPDASEEDYYTAFYYNLTISIVCAVSLFFCSSLIAGYFNQPILSSITKWMSLELVLGSLGMIPGTKLYKNLEFKTLAKINFICAVISGLVGLAVAYAGGGVWALVIQGLVSITLGMCLKWIYNPCKLLFSFSRDSFRQLFGYGSKLTISSLLNTVYAEMTTFVIGKYYSASSLGNYTRGKSMASLPINIINEVVGKVTFPILAKIQDDDEHLIKIYREYIALIMMAVVFVCMLMAALAKPMILFLLTEKWVAAIVFVQIFAFAIMFDPICSLNLNLLQVKGRSDLFLKLDIIKKFIAVCILIAAIPFGVVAICISKVVYTQVAVVANTYYTGKLFGLGYWTQMKDYMPYILYSALACIPAIILSYSCTWHIVSLLLGSVIAIALYIFILTKQKDKVYMQYIYPSLSIFYKKIIAHKL